MWGEDAVSGFVSEARMRREVGGWEGGPMALAGEELSILYWATNLLDKGCYS